MMRSFYFYLSLACLFYFCFELFYTAYAMMSVDDFWFAHWIYQYKIGIPYRDFSPYKTVLGYYFLLPFLLITHGVLTPLYSVKIALAVINTILFFCAALVLKRFFLKNGVLIITIALLFTQFVLVYSTNIRVDFLAYWLCFFSAVCLLEKKMFSAGLLIALGFLTSQKALWYIVASNAALGLYWLCYMRNWKYLRGILLFNATLILIVITYILFWSGFATLGIILKNMFYDAFIMYKLNTYDSARAEFWNSILTLNPILFFLWPVTLLSLIIVPENDLSYSRRVWIFVFASTIMLNLIFYKQPFPYYMLTTLPAFYLLYADFFSWVILSFSARKIKLYYLNQTTLLALSCLYVVGLSYLLLSLRLPLFYLSLALIPFILIAHVACLKQMTSVSMRMILGQLFWTLIVVIGMICPFTFFIKNLLYQNGAYQRNMVQLADRLLNEGGDYIAGIELFYDKNQPIQSLRHLDAPGLKYLFTQDKQLRLSMLSSLNHTPNASIPGAIVSLQQAHIKFYINNYRMNGLPKPIKDYLASEFEHYWGSIYLYAPLIIKGSRSVEIKFTGKYQLESHTLVQMDHVAILPNAIIQLNQGRHHSNAMQDYRLRFIPNNPRSLLNNDFREDAWENMLG